tara:strand:- start:240 stop:710 length:471 start_codon:yes stop_codon:yes gene_type:complete
MSNLSPKTALNIVKSKAKTIITATGKYEMTVISDPTNYVNDKGQHIVNLRAMTLEMKNDAIALLRANDLTKACNVNLTHNVFTDAFVPSKGETVFAQVGYVKNRKDEDVLRITSLSPMPVSKAVTTSASEFDEFANMLEDDAIVEVEASVEEPALD